VAIAKPLQSSAPEVDLEEAKTPVLAARVTSSSPATKSAQRRAPAVEESGGETPAARTSRTPLQPRRPAPARPPEETALAAATAATPPASRICVHCGARGEAAVRLCAACGRSPAAAGGSGSSGAPSVAAAKWKKPVALVPSAMERSSRRRSCQCGADNDITAAQCASCKAWF
jgi:hypothetical protein